jgi:hypothetical protein
MTLSCVLLLVFAGAQVTQAHRAGAALAINRDPTLVMGAQSPSHSS